jgi:hypothetical protein
MSQLKRQVARIRPTQRPKIVPVLKPVVQQNQQEAESEEGPSPLPKEKASSSSSKCRLVKTSILMVVMDGWLVVWRLW